VAWRPTGASHADVYLLYYRRVEYIRYSNANTAGYSMWHVGERRLRPTVVSRVVAMFAHDVKFVMVAWGVETRVGSIPS